MASVPLFSPLWLSVTLWGMSAFQTVLCGCVCLSVCLSSCLLISYPCTTSDSLLLPAPPLLTQPQANTEVFNGESVSVQCTVTSYPAATITWQRNGQVINDARFATTSRYCAVAVVPILFLPCCHFVYHRGQMNPALWIPCRQTAITTIHIVVSNWSFWYSLLDCLNQAWQHRKHRNSRAESTMQLRGRMRRHHGNRLPLHKQNQLQTGSRFRLEETMYQTDEDKSEGSCVGNKRNWLVHCCGRAWLDIADIRVYFFSGEQIQTDLWRVEIS